MTSTASTSSIQHHAFPERINHRMILGSTPGSAGITIIIGVCLAVAAIITVVTGSFIHWLFILAGIVVGLWAVASINK
ncbi:MAG: hypothetical protein MUF25_21810 [Pirellulaceae bacterium]|nr:hypothetical protein [Pirellulaceae bacterium]